MIWQIQFFFPKSFYNRISYRTIHYQVLFFFFLRNIQKSLSKGRIKSTTIGIQTETVQIDLSRVYTSRTLTLKWSWIQAHPHLKSYADITRKKLCRDNSKDETTRVGCCADASGTRPGPYAGRQCPHEIAGKQWHHRQSRVAIGGVVASSSTHSRRNRPVWLYSVHTWAKIAYSLE